MHQMDQFQQYIYPYQNQIKPNANMQQCVHEIHLDYLVQMHILLENNDQRYKTQAIRAISKIIQNAKSALAQTKEIIKGLNAKLKTI